MGRKCLRGRGAQPIHHPLLRPDHGRAGDELGIAQDIELAVALPHLEPVFDQVAGHRPTAVVGLDGEHKLAMAVLQGKVWTLGRDDPQRVGLELVDELEKGVFE